ncbi:MAG: hypothetical protein ACLFMM_08530 [Methanohalobium sp.]
MESHKEYHHGYEHVPVQLYTFLMFSHVSTVSGSPIPQLTIILNCSSVAKFLQLQEISQ